MRKGKRSDLYRVFHNSTEEAAKAILEDKEKEYNQRKIPIREILHHLGFHSYKRVDVSKHYICGECQICKKLEVSRRDNLPSVTFQVIFFLVLVLTFLIPLPWNTAILILSLVKLGLIGYLIKRLINLLLWIHVA